MEALQYRQDNRDGQNSVFENIATDLVKKGFSIQPNGLPQDLAEALFRFAGGLPDEEFDPAGVGRHQDQTVNRFVRKDEICWIDGTSPEGAQWLEWTRSLQNFLNRRLYLGL
ncbi:MAG: 2OG-Fe(II) oxygenase, partial [Ketobacteraceae bacterium]|nr:2OG-Fe(II) oxygenase [Ketobacteraceae bacterium]